MGGKTKFQSKWQDTRPWLRPQKGNIYGAFCTACNTTITVSSGVGNVQKHEIGDNHQKNVKVMDDDQSHFDVPSTSSKSKFFMTGKGKKVVFNSDQQKWNAEILRALNVVEKGYSFNSCNGDKELYMKMFPDSKIAANYQMQRTKCTYLLEFGILPYIKELVKKDIKGSPFTFHFDETTTEQVKKQYDGYVTYFSQKHSEIRTTYCGSLFVGKCAAPDLLVHFYEFMQQAGLDKEFMIGLGMDGPKVNLLFEKMLLKEVPLVRLGSCSLHTVNTGFGKALLSLKECVTDFDQLAIDFHFFFKYSAARREQYRKCEEITGLVIKMMERHCESRWLSLEKVLLKLWEQWENLHEYFINQVPTLPYFTGKKGVGQTARYGRIKSDLLNKEIPVAMAFLVYFAQDFKIFIKSFETSSPMIHLLFPRLMKLLRGVMGKFLKKDVYLTNDVMKSVNDLYLIDLQDESNHLASCSIGSRAEKMLKKMDPLKQKRLKTKLKEAMIASAHYLVQNLPIDEQVVYDAQFLGPQKQGTKKSLSAIKRLAREVTNALGPNALKEFYQLKEDESADTVVDRITDEYKIYQLEKIPASFTEVKAEQRKNNRASYWRYAYGLLDINVDAAEFSPDSSLVRLDHYWSSVGGITDEEGNVKYPNLCKLAKCCIGTLSHGNADPERGFSITKKQLQIHGTNIGEDMIVVIRSIKDFLLQNGGVSKFEVTLSLITRCENAHSQYLKKQEEMKKLNDDLRAAKESKQQAEKEDSEIAQLERDIVMLQNGLIMAKKLIDEGNEELRNHLLAEVLNRDALAQSNEKVAAGSKRAKELEVEIEELEQKRKKKK